MKPSSRVDHRQCVTCGRQLPERYSTAERCRVCHQTAVTKSDEPGGICVDCGKVLSNPVSIRCRLHFLAYARRSDWQPRSPDWQPRGGLAVEPSTTGEAERAYAAGMVDGEGHIGLAPWKGSFIPIANITNTDRRVIDWFAARWFGGSIATHDRRNDIHKPRHNWRLSGRRAYAFLKEMEPYLVIKRGQAEIVFAYYEQGGYFQHGADRLPAEEVIRRAQLHLQLKALNARGPRPAHDEHPDSSDA